MTLPRVVVRPGRDRSLRLRHPWLFAGAVAAVDGPAVDGGPVEVLDHRGGLLGCGVLNRRSQIVVRMLTFGPGQEVGASLWRERVRTAVARRGGLARDAATTAYRLVHAESDGLPGFVADRYGDWIVIQALSLAAERALPELVAGLVESCSPRGIVNRSDDEFRAKEGLEPAGGTEWGEDCPPAVEVLENGLVFRVDLREGHKTGFYLDQRDNRRAVAARADGAEVLDAFSYTGGFSVAAARGGASGLVQLDSSAPALELAAANLARNGFGGVACEQLQGDAFALLRRMRDAGREFDLVVLDPPKFAPVRSRLERALRGYKDVNLLGMKLLRPGGTLATFSCSAAVTPEVFQRTVFQASVDACREVRVVAELGQGEDHPVLLTFPESRYLKGLLCRVD